MRRRPAFVSVTGASALPVRLAVFRSEDWEGRDEAARYSEWMTARSAWKDAHGIVILPDDEAAWAAFPDEIWRPEDL